MTKVSDAELEVLNVIWDKKEVTSDVVIKEVAQFKWSPNTVRTLIKRLLNKGAIKCKKEGKIYVYMPVYNQDEYRAQESKRLLKKLYNNSAKEMILRLYEAGDLTNKDIEEVLKSRKSN